MPALVLLVGAALAGAVSFSRWRAEARVTEEAQRREVTEQRLREWQAVLLDLAGIEPPPFTDGEASSARLIEAAVRRVEARGKGSFDTLTRGLVPNDAWGRPFIYRCPGATHAHGWDLYSRGPDGSDDLGGNDDILTGEDVAAIASRD